MKEVLLAGFHYNRCRTISLACVRHSIDASLCMQGAYADFELSVYAGSRESSEDKLFLFRPNPFVQVDIGVPQK